MKNGSTRMGFHFSAFALTASKYPQNWDWYHNEFLGSGMYVGNTWRPTSAILRVEEPALGERRHCSATMPKSRPPVEQGTSGRTAIDGEPTGLANLKAMPGLASNLPASSHWAPGRRSSSIRAKHWVHMPGVLDVQLDRRLASRISSPVSNVGRERGG